MGRPVGSKNRTDETRAADTRQTSARQMPSSQFTGRLYVNPAIIPPGFTYAWIRISSFGEPDDDNWDLKSSEGWVAVPRNRHPELGRAMVMPGRENNPFSDVIVRGGLLLCEKSTEEVDERKEAFRALAMQRYQKVSEWTGGEGVDPLTPRFDQSSVQFPGSRIKSD